MIPNPTRRTFLTAAGAASTVLLAGCLGDDDEADGPTDNGDDDTPEGRARTYLNDRDAGGWDGDIVDEAGQDEIVIANGTGPSGVEFDPAGVRVDVGTTVVWEWTGEGGNHDVASVGESDFDLETDLTDEEGFTYEYTFDEEGVALYECSAHRAQGQYGAVIVQ